MSEFIQGMFVGGALVGGVIALGRWVVSSAKPTGGTPPKPGPGAEARRKGLGS